MQDRNRKEKSRNKRQRDSHTDPSRERTKKGVKAPIVDTDAYSEEMLRIQGLTICNSCNNPCPLSLVVCPTCGFEYKGD